MSDLPVSGAGCLVSTWTWSAVWTVETFTARWNLNGYTRGYSDGLYKVTSSRLQCLSVPT